MGIYGALSTAVNGLSAQATALDNISGNIANSQTVGYKRVDTSFEDMIPDASSGPVAGSVTAQGLATNTVSGTISSSDVATNMAINGGGFFMVAQPTGTSGAGGTTFSGTSYYTQQGDFTLNKDGYLVNSSGFYLEGLAVDPTTGKSSGAVPSPIQISNSLLPAQPTTQIDYQLNLPSTPQNGAYQATVPGSELLNRNDFLPVAAGTTTATLTGSALTGTANAATVMQPGSSMTVTAGGVTQTFDFYDSTVTGPYVPPAGTNNIGIDVSATTPVSVTTALASIQTALQGVGAPFTSATVGLNGGGNVQVGLGSDLTDNLTVADSTSGLGLGNTMATPIGPGPASITAAQNTDFLNQSIAGGAVTAYASNGSPENVVFRWVKTDSSTTGGQDTWNLYYTSNSAATGSQTMWTNVGQNYTFDSSGALVSPTGTTGTISGMSVNGVSLGNVTLNYGTNGITQFGDSSGEASVTTNDANGYSAGQFSSIAIDNSGRVVASYTNGQQVDVAQIVTANFNGADALQQVSGNAFEATADSGSPLISENPSISGSALEASNVDISTEFSNLIVTQQAYSAGAKVVTTANQMLQTALSMIQ